MKTFDEIDYKRNQYKLLLSISVLVFLVILLFTIFYFVDYNNNYGYFKAVTAEVVEYEVNDGKNYAVIEYVVGDTTYQKTTHYTNMKIGKKTKIFYDENNPVGIIYDRDFKYYLLPTMTILFAGADITLIIFYIEHYKKKDALRKNINGCKNNTNVSVSNKNEQGQLNKNTKNNKVKKQNVGKTKKN